MTAGTLYKAAGADGSGLMVENTQRLEKAVTAMLNGMAADPLAHAATEQAWLDAKRQNLDEKNTGRAFIQNLRHEGGAHLLPAILKDLTSHLPNQAWAWVLAAENAAATGDTASFLALSGELRTRFPGMPAATRLTLEAAIAAGRMDEAAALIATLTADQAREDWALSARIAIAEHENDHAAALNAGTALAARRPKRPDGALAIATALSRVGRYQEAEQRIAALLPQFPTHPAVLRAAAEIAEQSGDIETALTRWGELRKRARGTPVPFLGTLRCLRVLKRLDLAMPVVYEGLARFPDNEALLVDAAKIAESAAQAEDADLFWQRVVQRCPDNPAYALSAAMSLAASPVGRPGRMPEVLRRLQAHHAAFPRYEEAYAAHINAFRTAKKPAMAIAASRDWCAQFPQSVAIALARVGAYEDQGFFDDALREIEALRTRVPHGPEVEITYARVLSSNGRYDEAETICAAALKKTPSHLRLLVEYARIATRRGDWTEGHARLVHAQTILPDNERIATEIQNVRLQMAEEITELPQAGADSAIARFESLGGTGVSCEFAMIQRRLGADSVGLLRWSRNDINHLLDALGAEFEGVGSEENTILKTARHNVDNEEYVTQDRRYFMESHTFVRTADAPMDSMFKQTCRRLRFLKGKLIEDLRAAEKMFIFKAHRAITDEEAAALHRALQAYGDNALLCVMRAGPGTPRGTLRVVGRGLYVGYVSHFINDESGNAGSDIATWEALCREADAHWRAAALPAVA